MFGFYLLSEEYTTSRFISSLPHNLREAAEEIQTTTSFPEHIEGLSNVLGLILPLMPLVKIVDGSNKKVWGKWESTIPELKIRARKYEDNIKNKRKPGKSKNPWLYRRPKQPLLALLADDSEKSDEKLKLRMPPLKATMLSAFYNMKYGYKELSKLEELCAAIRTNRGPSKNTLIQKHIPEIKGHNDFEWPTNVFSADFPIILPMLTDDFRIRYEYPPADYWLHQFRKVLEILYASENPPTQFDIEFDDSDNDDLYDIDNKGKPKKTSYGKRIKIYIKPQETEDFSDKISEPDIETAVILEETLADELAVSLPSLNLEVKYTNYRTALENQSLPYTWDQLNNFEIYTLINAIRESDLSNDEEYIKGGFLSWLLLTTGQPLQDLLSFIWLNENSNGLANNGAWVRTVPELHKPFKPDSTQVNFLSEHSPNILLYLPRPFPKIMSDKISQVTKNNNTSQSVSDAFDIEYNKGEEYVRKFLLEQRSTRQARLMPARIRRVLSNNILQDTGDKVLTYILTGINPDSHHTGNYYTYFPRSFIQDKYKNTINNIFSIASLGRTNE